VDKQVFTTSTVYTHSVSFWQSLCLYYCTSLHQGLHAVRLITLQSSKSTIILLRTFGWRPKSRKNREFCLFYTVSQSGQGTAWRPGNVAQGHLNDRRRRGENKTTWTSITPLYGLNQRIRPAHASLGGQRVPQTAKGEKM